MTAADFIKLIEGFKNQSLSARELEEFLDASKDPVFERLLASSLQDDLKSAWAAHQQEKAIPPAETTVVHIRRSWRGAAAAVAILLAGAFYFIYRHQHSVKEPLLAHQTAGSGRSNGKNVILTIGNRPPIVLDSAGNGLVTTLGNTVINNTKGQLVYESNGESMPVDNRVETPAGTQYSVVLPDGTKAWLNAGSSLTFPSSFTGKERIVSTTGEVYFEVAQNAAMPFGVNVDNTTQIKVLGTSFNINAYREEGNVSTTLLEGAVQVNNGTNSQQLAPGQQARVGNDGKIALIRHVNTEQVLGWKNGYFIFSGVNIEHVMNQYFF